MKLVRESRGYPRSTDEKRLPANGKSSVSSEFMDEIHGTECADGFPGRGICITLIAIILRFCEKDTRKVGERDSSPKCQSPIFTKLHARKTADESLIQNF